MRVALWAVAAAFVSVSLAGATPITLDPLHGYCGGTGQCPDNGSNSPTSNNPPKNFGFTVSPGPASGDLFIDVLVPNNEDSGITNFGLTGSLSGTATLFSSTPWTSGQLDSYLGISASPSNPIGAYLPCTQSPGSCGDAGAGDPGATGFFVYQVNLGTITLDGPSNPNSDPLENLSTTVPGSSFILGFFNEGTAGNPDWVATANSGAIYVDSGTTQSTTPTVPEPASLFLLGSGLVLGANALRRRKRT